MIEIIPAEFGAEKVALSRDVSQRKTQKNFTHAAAIKRRGVYQVHAVLKGYVNTAQGLASPGYIEYVKNFVVITTTENNFLGLVYIYNYNT